MGWWKPPTRSPHFKNASLTFRCVCPSSSRHRLSSLARIVLPAGCAASSLSLLMPPSARSATKDSQWRTTASTTTLKIVGNSGSPVSRLSIYERVIRSTLPSTPLSAAAPNTCGGGGGSWAPLHIPPGFLCPCNFPSHLMPCAGTGGLNGAPPPSWPQPDGAY